MAANSFLTATAPAAMDMVLHPGLLNMLERKETLINTGR